MNIYKGFDGKNHNYGKIVEGVLELSPAVLISVDGKSQYIGNYHVMYANAGYLPIDYAEKPEDTDKGHYEAVYTETDGRIVQSWEFVSDPEEAFWSKELILKVVSNRASLTDITFPEGITAIESSFFNGASNLVIAELPDTITTIKASAFYDCGKLGLNKLPESLTYIGDSAFRGAWIRISELPPQLKTINSYAFLNRSAITISVMPATVQTLGTRCFEGCTGITEMTFKGTPTSIGAGIFNNCSKLVVINVPWAETDAINANAPWGATNATINYNYVETEE